METSHCSKMRLYGAGQQRLYINASERAGFLKAAEQAGPEVRTLCLTLTYTGCRISEALALTPSSIQAEARLITIHTLKRRQANVMREVPVPPVLISSLLEVHGICAHGGANPDRPLWRHAGIRLSRSTAYRWIKSVMHDAAIVGAQASPKGLRHGYGIHAIRSGVQLNMLQKWMGHASMDTTAIYANAIGAEELAIADRMWD
jgi:integrase